MREGNVSLEVLVGGKVVREYRDTDMVVSGGTYVAGDHGKDFTVRVRNHTASRIIAVVSVDGLSVIDGKKASVNGPGYVVDGYSFVDIPGWRRSDNEVAKFEFVESDSSYASQMKKEEKNIGVIGVAAFAEKPHKAPAFFDRLSKGASRGLKNIAVAAGPPSVGTGYGNVTEHNVHTVSFKRASASPDRVISLFYETEVRLRELGIIKDGKRIPQAFPSIEHESAQTPPPPGWKARETTL